MKVSLYFNINDVEKLFPQINHDLTGIPTMLPYENNTVNYHRDKQGTPLLECTDAPLGGDRGLYSGSLRTTVAPESNRSTCADSM